jgi:hypothetical protein
VKGSVRIIVGREAGPQQPGEIEVKPREEDWRTAY